jgi:hypothetical protein
LRRSNCAVMNTGGALVARGQTMYRPNTFERQASIQERAAPFQPHISRIA